MALPPRRPRAFALVRHGVGGAITTLCTRLASRTGTALTSDRSPEVAAPALPRSAIRASLFVIGRRGVRSDGDSGPEPENNSATVDTRVNENRCGSVSHTYVAGVSAIPR